MLGMVPPLPLSSHNPASVSSLGQSTVIFMIRVYRCVSRFYTSLPPSSSGVWFLRSLCPSPQPCGVGQAERETGPGSPRKLCG